MDSQPARKPVGRPGFFTIKPALRRAGPARPVSNTAPSTTPSVVDCSPLHTLKSGWLYASKYVPIHSRVHYQAFSRVQSIALDCTSQAWLTVCSQVRFQEALLSTGYQVYLNVETRWVLGTRRSVLGGVWQARCSGRGMLDTGSEIMTSVDFMKYRQLNLGESRSLTQFF